MKIEAMNCVKYFTYVLLDEAILPLNQYWS